MLVGGSFALPVWLAFYWMNRGVPALEWLASGAIAEGRLKPVERLESKQRLADKLGVRLWLTVGSLPSNAESVFFSPGTSLNGARGIVEEALEHHGLVPLSEASILTQAVSLELRVERKTVDYTTARTRAEKWKQWLDANGKKQRPAYLKTLVILSAIDNHDGHAPRADAYIREILGTNWRHCALDRFQAINQIVVSLADRMMLEESERVARELVAEIENANFGSEEDYLLHKLGAIGALGGEALLFKALRGMGGEQESKKCLEEAAQIALQLIETCGAFDSHRYHYSKSAVRTALWTALFDPEQMAEAVERIGSSLKRVAADKPVSLAFLSRHRLLREADGPLLQLIHLSILVQANELFAQAGEAPLFPESLQLAVLAKIPEDTFDPLFWQEWIRRAKGDLSVDPQKAFPY
ncbi:MAG: hypothetical protein EBS01_03585 [Verrucomicrobia bacterium]|nr:hypothetical protein [Verrucomicrobiota bacterium]